MAAESDLNLFAECRLCPRQCGTDRRSVDRRSVDRRSGPPDRGAPAVGFCGVGSGLRLARAALHYWEEPVISGTPEKEGELPPGSGAVFFSGCNLRCAFCQNRDIARAEIGRAVTPERLTEIFLELQAKGALNLNLVTATHYTPLIPPAVRAARERGLTLPVVWNSSAYELPETLRLLEGTVDVYLPDFKYWSPELAARYSRAADYPERALAAIDEMLRQTGEPVFDERGLIRRGVIIRHLLLPGHLDDSKRVLRHLYKRYGDAVWFSLMNQYTPLSFAPAELARPVTEREYTKLIDYAFSLGIENAFIQEGGTVGESFIPAFDYEGVTAESEE